MFLCVSIGWEMTCKKNIYFTCVISYNVMKHLFVTVINQKYALAIWGMMRCFASCIDIVNDGN